MINKPTISTTYFRCECGCCEIMASATECICCREIDEIVAKIGVSESEIQCITEHEGFEAVCLNVWVLQTGYFNYRQQYGGREDPVHE